MNRPKLGVNVDHVATIRQARNTRYPDPVVAAAQAELAGADQITVHLREDRRHIQDRDVRLLRETVQTRLNLEMAATDAMLKFALEIRPDMVTLVPEKREEQTTEGGLDVAGQSRRLAEYIEQLAESGGVISLFIDPEQKQVEASKVAGATVVELHTGDYATYRSADESYAAYETRRDLELEKLKDAASYAASIGLVVAAGHGLDYENVAAVAAIDVIEEFNIGHSIVSRSMFVGFTEATAEMIAALESGRFS